MLHRKAVDPAQSNQSRIQQKEVQAELAERLIENLLEHAV
jgi:hypothetical protein